MMFEVFTICRDILLTFNIIPARKRTGIVAADERTTRSFSCFRPIREDEGVSLVRSKELHSTRPELGEKDIPPSSYQPARYVYYSLFIVYYSLFIVY